MHLASLVEMVESGFDDRVLLRFGDAEVTGADFGHLVRRGASTLGEGCEAIVYVGENHPMFPVALLSAAWAGVPFIPVNYRLDDSRLNALIERSPRSLVLADKVTAPRVAGGGARVFDEWLRNLPDAAEIGPADDDEAMAIVLYTSGTTAEPKSALLRHRHLMAYLLGTVEFGSAGDSEAMLVSVPPYHIAGVANLLSNLFAGRRLVYLQQFDPLAWLATVREEGISHSMLVPTMLARIVEILDGEQADVPTLQSISYGGAKLSERVLRAALDAFPTADFVNAYGLTETASTIALLGPDDHRRAVDSDDPAVRRRLASAGLVLPTVELEIRDDSDKPLPSGELGMIFVRGEQIAGEYATGNLLDTDGWFCTRDRGRIDEDGYLYLEGRTDDIIIRGGENIAPTEIEDVLLSHPDVLEACVVGLPDEEWGQRIVAVVVRRAGTSVSGDELRAAVYAELRGSKTPETVFFRPMLPHTDTGKTLRRVVQQDLASHSTDDYQIAEHATE